MSQPKHIVILTGAGVSAESGIPTFRGAGGLWEGHDAMKLATPEAFAADPALVHRFYNMRRSSVQAAAPNAAHQAIGRLQREYPGRVTLITQNIDDLHERAGSPEVIHMHGEILRSRCAHCSDVAECRTDLSGESGCGACGRAGGLRPHVVWFGEMPLHMDEISTLLASAGIFAAIGTSGLVYPAAGFARTARMAGAHTMEFNLETAARDVIDEFRSGPAGETIPQWVCELLVETGSSN